MPESKVDITLTWENEKTFKMTCKKNNQPIILVLQTDENNHILETWAEIEKICNLFFSKEIEQIGNEMKQ